MRDVIREVIREAIRGVIREIIREVIRGVVREFIRDNHVTSRWDSRERGPDEGSHQVDSRE